MDGGIILEKTSRLTDIKKSEAFLGAIFDGISEEIMVVDGDGLILDVNRVFLDERGLSKKAVLGKKCLLISETYRAPPVIWKIGIVPFRRPRRPEKGWKRPFGAAGKENISRPYAGSCTPSPTPKPVNGILLKYREM